MPEVSLLEPPVLDASELRPTSVHAARDGRLAIREPVTLGADPAADAVIIRFLAEATSHFVDVDWELAGEPPYAPRDLVHLSPPRRCVDPAGARFAEDWRASFRFGLCSYRHGPGFRAVRDVRPDGDNIRVLVDDPWVEAFDELVANPVARPGDLPLLEELIGAGLALRLGERHHVVLPYRLVRRPIPYSAV